MNCIFEDVETGEQVEEDIPMRLAPDFGDVIKLGKRKLRRLVTMPGIAVAGDLKFKDNGQLPANYKYHLMAGGKCDAEGNCLFDGARQMRETEAMANHHGERIRYMGLGLGKH